MRKAVLLYNPDSGASVRHHQSLKSAVRVLHEAGVDAKLVPTDSSPHSIEQAQAAIADGCDTLFACGGDGTIHTVVQALAKSQVALAVLPMGTANALAHDLGLPLEIPAAARAALRSTPRRIPLGRVQYRDFHGNSAARYFVITAGIGVDAHLFYKLHAGVKRRLGMTAYYAKAWHLWWTYPMTRFRAEFAETGSTDLRRMDVTELMSVRIRNFGGVLQELAPGASLDRDDLRLILCHTSSRAAYLSYVTRSLLRRRWPVKGIELASTAKVACEYLPPQGPAGQPPKIYVEADGELLGTLPVEITIIPDALTLLSPGI